MQGAGDATRKALDRKAEKEAARKHRAAPDGRCSAAGDLAPKQPQVLLVALDRQSEALVGLNRGRKAPLKPPRRPRRGVIEGRNQHKAILRFVNPHRAATQRSCHHRDVEIRRQFSIAVLALAERDVRPGPSPHHDRRVITLQRVSYAGISRVKQRRLEQSDINEPR